MAAINVLNNRYYYKRISAIGETRIYFLQDRQKSEPDMVCVYVGDLKSDQAVIANIDLFYAEETNLKLFRFYPQGVQRDFFGYEYSARQSSIAVVKRPERLILFLDQLFGGGGSGGHRELIARKFMVVEDGVAQMTGDYSIITDFRISYPRHYGPGVWAKGSMSYSNCFNHQVSVEDNKLIVSFEKQQFELESLFATADEVTPKPEKGFWGEQFTYNDFTLPAEVAIKNMREREEFKLGTLLIRRGNLSLHNNHLYNRFGKGQLRITSIVRHSSPNYRSFFRNRIFCCGGIIEKEILDAFTKQSRLRKK